MAGRSPPAWLTQTTFAHRGLHSDKVPENSLAAAEAAIESGLGIECDIQRSADDWPMVFHDWDLARLTGAVGSVEDHTADELEALALIGSKQTPIRLQRFLETLAGRAPLLIEIKSRPAYDVEWTCQYVSRTLEQYSGRYAVMSFDPRVPEWFKANVPQTCRGLVGTDSLPNGFEHMWRDLNLIEQAEPDFLAIDRRDLSRPEAAEWRAAGNPLLTWTVRTREEAKVAGLLADALIAEGEAVG